MNTSALLIGSLTCRLTLMVLGMMYVCALATPGGLRFVEPNRYLAIAEILVVLACIVWMLLEGIGFLDWIIKEDRP